MFDVQRAELDDGVLACKIIVVTQPGSVVIIVLTCTSVGDLIRYWPPARILEHLPW